MSQREKLLAKMRRAPGSIRFAEIDALLKSYDFVLFNSRGSPHAYHHVDGLTITIVRPHGNKKTCNPRDVRRLLEILGA